MIGYLVMVVRISCDDCWCVQIRCTSHSTVRGCHQSTVCGVCGDVECECVGVWSVCVECSVCGSVCESVECVLEWHVGVECV